MQKPKHPRECGESKESGGLDDWDSLSVPNCGGPKVFSNCKNVENKLKMRLKFRVAFAESLGLLFMSVFREHFGS